MAEDGKRAGGLPEGFSYRAFISYSHRDKAHVRRLHREVESFRIPKKLVGRVTSVGEVPRRLAPVFRDRDELPASSDLGAQLRAAISGSMFLIVICSPASATSHWVDQEIINFKRAHGEGNLLALIVDGTPYGSDTPGQEEDECFPRALRYVLGPDGELSDVRTEPIAADLRPDADGPRLARLKLIAGLTGLKLDELVQRETQRRMRSLAMVASGAVAGMVLTGGLAFYANAARLEAIKQREIARTEAKAARAASDYLVNTFEVSNPASENPRTITALTILSRSAARARDELADQPVIQARLLATLGKAYNSLGLLTEAQGAFESSLPAIRKAGPDGAEALLMLSETYSMQGALDKATETVSQAERLLGPNLEQHLQQRGQAALVRGRILTLASEVGPGLAAFRKAQEYLEADKDTPPDKLAALYTDQGVLLSDAGQFKEADLALSKALAIRRRTLGDNHLKTSSAWSARAQNSYLSATAQTPFIKSQLQASEIQVGNALTIQRRVLEGDNPILADNLSMRGQVLADEGKLLQAERTLREAIAMYRRAFGRPHSKIGIAEIYLAQIQSDQNNPQAALQTLADAKHNYDVSYGKVHPNHGDLLVYRAKVLAKAGRIREARADCDEGLKILRATLGADASFTKTNEAKCAALDPSSPDAAPQKHRSVH